MRRSIRHAETDDIGDLYDELQQWAANLCEHAYQDSLVHGRRRRAARMDFVPGWKEAARQLGRPDVFVGLDRRREASSVSHGLNEDDLAPWARRELDAAYEARERPRCSREDFADGFIAALRALHSKSAFLPGRYEEVPA
jgi:hypothetical protein